MLVDSSIHYLEKSRNGDYDRGFTTRKDDAQELISLADREYTRRARLKMCLRSRTQQLGGL